MGKRLPYTPRSIIKHAIRKIWLRSRERQAALKRDDYTCQRCGRKQSRAKGKEVMVHVHHTEGTQYWDKAVDSIYECILPSPDKLVTLCKGCHEKVHGREI